MLIFYTSMLIEFPGYRKFISIVSKVWSLYSSVIKSQKQMEGNLKRSTKRVQY